MKHHSKFSWKLGAVAVLLWCAASILVYVSMDRSTAFDGSVHAQILFAFTAPLLAAIGIAAALMIWYLVFDEGPKRLRRLWIGPPWKSPRTIYPFAGKQERGDHTALKQRLKQVGENRDTRTNYYVDKSSGQYWRGDYIEQGFGSDEIFVPIEKSEIE